MTRADREAKAVDAVRQWLPELQPGGVIHIEAREPTEDNPALFRVTRTPVTFVCRRGWKEADRG